MRLLRGQKKDKKREPKGWLPIKFFGLNAKRGLGRKLLRDS